MLEDLIQDLCDCIHYHNVVLVWHSNGPQLRLFGLGINPALRAELERTILKSTHYYSLYYIRGLLYERILVRFTFPQVTNASNDVWHEIDHIERSISISDK